MPTRIRNGAVRPSGTYLMRPTLTALKNVASRSTMSTAKRYETPPIAPNWLKATGTRELAIRSPRTR